MFICRPALKSNQRVQIICIYYNRNSKMEYDIYLAKPNGSYNYKANEADLQDLPFLSRCWKTGMVATLNPQPDTA